VALIRRFPRLLEIQYQDGRGFASDETRGWLRTEMSARAGGGGDGDNAPAVDPFVEGSREIRSLAARGKLVDAVKVAMSKIDNGATPRDRFRWRLLLAGICLDAGQTSVASVQLNTLDREMESHGLEEWEPGLSLEALQALYKCEKKMSQNGNRDNRESLQKMDRLYERLCRIDILSALALEGKK
jgi:type VI secretion system protein VasJ